MLTLEQHLIQSWMYISFISYTLLGASIANFVVAMVKYDNVAARWIVAFNNSVIVIVAMILMFFTGFISEGIGELFSRGSVLALLAVIILYIALVVMMSIRSKRLRS